MPYAVAGLAAFLQRYGSLVRAMAERGLTRGQVRMRFLVLFPEESPALLEAAIAQHGDRFRPETTAPQLGDAALAAGVWLALAQHLRLPPDPDHAALHLDAETVRDVTALLLTTDISGASLPRVLALIGAAQRHCADHAPAAFGVQDYERARLALCTEAAFLSSIAHHWPAPEREVSRRLGDGRWSGAVARLGLRAPEEPTSSATFTEEEYAGAVTAFLSHCRSTGTRPTTERYGRWAVEQGARRTPRPYFDGVRRFFGSWEEAMHFASGRQAEGGPAGDGFADTRTWSDLATPEAQEMLGRAGIGVVSADGGPPEAVDEDVWEDLHTLIASVLARLPWNDFLVIEYEPVQDHGEAPVAWAGVGPHGVDCAVVSGGQLAHAAWPVDATFFHEDEWNEPTAWDQPWTVGPVGFQEAAQRLVDGLRFGWGCADPYRFHWGVGSFPTALGAGDEATLIAPALGAWGAPAAQDAADS